MSDLALLLNLNTIGLVFKYHRPVNVGPYATLINHAAPSDGVVDNIVRSWIFTVFFFMHDN